MSSSVGLNLEGGSNPSPCSCPVKTFRPKWKNAPTSQSANATCSCEGLASDGVCATAAWTYESQMLTIMIGMDVRRAQLHVAHSATTSQSAPHCGVAQMPRVEAANPTRGVSNHFGPQREQLMNIGHMLYTRFSFLSRTAPKQSDVQLSASQGTALHIWRYNWPNGAHRRKRLPEFAAELRW